MASDKTIKVQRLINHVEQTQRDIKRCNDVLRPQMRTVRSKKYPRNQIQYSIRTIILTYEEWKKEIVAELKKYNKLLKQNKNASFWEFQLAEMKELQEEIRNICKNQKKLIRFLL